jgi:hypothetical protein
VVESVEKLVEETQLAAAIVALLVELSLFDNRLSPFFLGSTFGCATLRFFAPSGFFLLALSLEVVELIEATLAKTPIGCWVCSDGSLPCHVVGRRRLPKNGPESFHWAVFSDISWDKASACGSRNRWSPNDVHLIAGNLKGANVTGWHSGGGLWFRR